jgi:hypothetical protein
MPQPTQTSVHVDAVLTNLSVAYLQKVTNFVSGQVFKVIPVDKQSDLYFIYEKGDWFRDEAEIRADGTESAGSGYTLANGNYFCPVYAFHKDIGDQVRENTDNPLDPDRDATQFVTQRMLVRQEVQWASDYFTPTASGAPQTWANEVVGAGQSNPNSLPTFTCWDDYAGSDPINDVENGKQAVLQNTGFLPNVLVIGYQVWRALRNHPEIVDRIKYTSADVISEQLLAKYFQVDKVLVAQAIVNTAKEGQANDFAFIMGRQALLAYANPNPGILQPSAGYQFTWTGVSDGLGQNVGMSRFRMQHLRADRIEAQMAWVNKVIGSDLGYMFDYATST